MPFFEIQGMRLQDENECCHEWYDILTLKRYSLSGYIHPQNSRRRATSRPFWLDACSASVKWRECENIVSEFCGDLG